MKVRFKAPLKCSQDTYEGSYWTEIGERQYELMNYFRLPGDSYMLRIMAEHGPVNLVAHQEQFEIIIDERTCKRCGIPESQGANVVCRTSLSHTYWS